MPDRLDPVFVKRQIELLRVTHPGIWDEDETLLADMLEAETGFNEFLAAVVRRYCEAEAFAAGIDYLMSDLKARRDRFEQRSNAMRALAFKIMTVAAVRKVELTQATLSIHAGSAKVIITDEAALPEDCWRVRREPNKTRIRDLLLLGEPVAGAEMSNAEPFLAIRVK